MNDLGNPFILGGLSVLGVILVLGPLIFLSRRSRARYALPMGQDGPTYAPDSLQPHFVHTEVWHRQQEDMKEPNIPEVPLRPAQPVHVAPQTGHMLPVMVRPSRVSAIYDVENEEDLDMPEPVPFTPVVTASAAPLPPVVPVVVRKKRREYQFCVGTSVKTKEPVYFPLGHGFAANRTRSGKSNIVAIMTGQALEQDIDVWYLSVGYAPVDEDGLDISPLIDRCKQVAIDPDANGLDALQMLRDAWAVIRHRQHLAIEQKIGHFDPILIIGEELKALQAVLKLVQEMKIVGYENAVGEASALMDIILSMGAKFNVNYWAVAQDGQGQTVKLSRGTLRNIEIRFVHPSLDSASRRNLMPEGYNLKENPLPETTSPYQWYQVMDYGGGMQQIEVIDVPKVDNAAVARYIRGIPVVVRGEPKEESPAIPSGPISMREVGKAPTVPDAPPTPVAQPSTPPAEERELFGGPNITSVVGGKLVSSTNSPTDYLKVRDLMEHAPEISQSEVARQLWGEANGRYNQRAKQIMEVVRPFVHTPNPNLENEIPDQEA